jgi:hypothetical protein
MDEREANAGPSDPPWFNRTVGGVGLTSALGDFCYETATVILPGFLAVLGIPAAVLLATLAFVLGVDGVFFPAAIFCVAGFYMAVQEALESTVTADMVSGESLAMSYGALGTVNGVAKLASSTIVGVAWTAVSPVLGFGLAAGIMTAGTFAMWRLRR